MTEKSYTPQKQSFIDWHAFSYTLTMFTKEELKKIEARAKERNSFRHERLPSGKALCPVTGETVQWVHTAHDRPGFDNICDYCCTEEEAAESKSLSELNEERRLKCGGE